MTNDQDTTRPARSRRTAALAWLVLAGLAPSTLAAGPGIRNVSPDDTARTSAAVVVDGSKDLAHTAQLLAVDAEGKFVGAGRADAQADAVLDRLETALREAGSGLDRLVRVNVYATGNDALAAFRAALARRLGDRARPSMSAVVGALTNPEALLALDAVGVSDQAAPPGTVPRSRATFAVLPAGVRIYVSGQADPDPDLARATRLTLEGLRKTLAFLNVDKSDVIQLKAFLQPATEAARVEQEIVTFFGSAAVPPLVFVDWRSGAKQPIEIELIVAGGRLRPE